jgi:hypothetical protein
LAAPADQHLGKEKYSPSSRPFGHALVVSGVAVIVAGLLPGFHNNLFFSTDVILLILLPVTWSRARHIRPLRRFVQLCALWAASQVVSNLMNGVPAGDLLDGVWQPVLLATSSVGLFWFTDGIARHAGTITATVFVLLVTIGAIVSLSDTSTDPWKYHFGIPVTLLGVLFIGLLWTAHRTVASAVLTASLGGINIVLGFRSLGAVCLVGASLLLVISPIKKSSLLRISLAVVAGIVVGTGTSYVYGTLAESGRLGYAQQAKYEAQTSSQAGLLLTARPEALLSLRTIRDRPVFGLGSGARLDYATTERLLEAAAIRGIELSSFHQQRLIGNGVNSHSLALGAWVQAGILAVLPWLYLIALGLRTSFVASSQQWAFLRPLTVLWTMLCIWDFLFSPWSPHYQVLLGSFVALLAGQLEDGQSGNTASSDSRSPHRPPARLHLPSDVDGSRQSMPKRANGPKYPRISASSRPFVTPIKR